MDDFFNFPTVLNFYIGYYLFVGVVENGNKTAAFVFGVYGYTEVRVVRAYDFFVYYIAGGNLVKLVIIVLVKSVGLVEGILLGREVTEVNVTLAVLVL